MYWYWFALACIGMYWSVLACIDKIRIGMYWKMVNVINVPFSYANDLLLAY